MQRQAPTLGRILVMAGFALSVFGLLLYLWVAFGGATPLKAKGYRFKVAFPEASQLAREADVRISGVPVGKVKQIKEGGGRSVATIEMQRRYAPVHADARAILRQKTLLGETYVELTPGRRSAPKIKEGGTLARAQVSPTVELDEIFRALDAPTRRQLQTWLQSQAGAVDGRGRDLNEAIGNLAPFSEDANRLLEILQSQRGAVRRLISNTGDVFAALTERDGQLRGLIEDSERVFNTTAQRNLQLQQTFAELPGFERESKVTLDRLARFSRSANPLVTQLRPAARELSPTLVDLGALAPDLRALFRDLNPLIDASRRGLPALERLLDDLRPMLAQLGMLLPQLNPVADYLGLYKREITSFLSNVPASTQATDKPPGARSPIHYLRTTNPVNPENLAVYPRRIATNRPNPYQLPGGFDFLGKGLRVYEDRQCTTGFVPVLGPAVLPLFPEALRTLIEQAVFGNLSSGNTPAPPCVKQPKFNLRGRVTQYPQVHAEPRP